MQAASSDFEKAAGGISRAFTTRSNTADSADLSTSVVSLLEAKDNFAANAKTARVEDEIIQSTFSIIG